MTLEADNLMPPEPEKASDEDAFSDMRSAGPWLKMIEEAEKTFDRYHTNCDNIDKIYSDLEKLAGDSGERQMQMFWANIEVLKPSIYARAPVPVVTPKFKSRKSLPRTAADVLERCLLASYDLEDVHQQMLAVRDDLVLGGRGQMWLRYEMDEDSQTQAVRYEHVERRDFLHDPARKWSEVRWVARRAWLTDEKGKARFPNEWQRVQMEARKDSAVDNSEGEKVGEVWEIWHREKGVVVWVAAKQQRDGNVLDIQPPPFNLHRFFPCPKPAYATLKRGTLRPVPDFNYYKDQISEINELTARISALSEGLKLKGFYAAGVGDIAEAIETAMKATDNNAILIPVPNWAALGGVAIKDSIAWLPIVDVATTIKELIILRQQLITDVYQITGISDIMRGSTDAGETLGAQQLKSQYGNVRIRDRQEALINLALEVTEIAAEIMAENFAPETLKTLSQIEDVPTQADIQQQIMGIQQQVMQAQQNPQIMAMAQQNPQQAQQLLMQAQQQIQTLQNTVTWEAVVQLLQDQKTRPFVLDIETNSTIQPDEQADKMARTEALTAIGGFLGQALPLVQAAPESGPFVAETLKWVASGFRMGRGMETSIDEFSDKIAQIAKQPKPPAPEQIKAQAEAEKAKAEVEIKKEELGLKREEIGIKKQEVGFRKEEMGMQREGMAAEHKFKDRELGMKAMEGMRSRHDQKQQAATEVQGKTAEHSLKERDMALREAEAKAEQEQSAKIDDIAKAVAELTKVVSEMRQSMQAAG
jgi:hypothetical protein